MTVRRILAALTLALGAPANGAVAHEFWIEPQQYQVESGAPVVADFKNGENFGGITLAYFERRTARYDIVQNGDTTAVEARMGDIPALETQPLGDGLLVAVHQTAHSTIAYTTWSKFQRFADHKDFPDIRARHQARGLPEMGFEELYVRFAKALVGVGHAQGADAETGMETEFVAEANPYTDDLNGTFPVRLLYRGVPRRDAQVEVFDRGPDDFVIVSTQRTDAEGRVWIPVTPGHRYLLDAVILRPAAETETAVWETLWAALTFQVPAER
ncbi:DUF4198 domain-containing protein [Thalassococcus sp. S3]|uniref:DUF4198 domain-containing protein n=1 Tax=Thalassococcus sp. S3 TaxID=2017482 RepID=UPI0010241F46|nr:DUF4198 domain-containing protein [Thalassococcus sp. S3]QBF33160.1 hypothetical protein CFI11_18295 [Thalassococcus sp. S3]